MAALFSSALQFALRMCDTVSISVTEIINSPTHFSNSLLVTL